MATLLSGRFPSAMPMCGLTHQGEQAEVERPWCSHFPDDVPILPEILALYGYQTAMVRSHALGFDTLGAHFQQDMDVTPADGQGGTPWSALQAAATTWWDEHADTPRLLVVVVSDLLYTQRVDVQQELGVVGWSGEDRTIQQGLPLLRHAALMRYESDAAQVGQQFASLIQGLAPHTRPRWNFITATEGLSIAEIRGRVSQRDYFFSRAIIQDRILHVPLLVDGPVGAAEPGEREDLVQLLDFVPTLTRLAGAMAPAGMAGRDLLSTPDPQRVAYAEFGDMVGVWQGQYGLVFKVPMHNITSLDPALDALLLADDVGRHLFLYDVLADPMQLRPLKSENRGADPLLEALYSELVRIRRGPGAPPAAALTPEHLREIKLSAAEGYW